MSDLSSLIAPPDYFERFHGKFFGKYRARVADNDDPERLGRVRVYCQPVYGTDMSPWCTPCFPGGHLPDAGAFDVAPKDSMVWVEFEEGSPEAPIWVGGFPTRFPHPRPSDGTTIEEATRRLSASTPRHFQGMPDGTDFEGGVRGEPGAEETGFRGQYPYVRGQKTVAGNGIEFDDTPLNHRARVFHSSGSSLEFLHDGTAHLLSSAGIVERSETRRTTVSGSADLSIGGDYRVRVNGSYVLEVIGSYSVDYEDHTISADRLELIGRSGVSVQSLGSVSVESGTLMQLSSGGRIQVTGSDQFSLLTAGSGEVLFGNVNGLTNPLSYAMDLGGIGGRVRISASDPTGQAYRYGVEMIPNNLSGTPATAGQLGPVVKLGNLRVPLVPDPVPLVQEPVVMGMQLHLFLQQLTSFLQVWLGDYLAHVHTSSAPGSPTTPSISAPVVGPVISPQLSALQATFLTPSGPKLQPLLLSDVVVLSKS